MSISRSVKLRTASVSKEIASHRDQLYMQHLPVHATCGMQDLPRSLLLWKGGIFSPPRLPPLESSRIALGRAFRWSSPQLSMTLVKNVSKLGRPSLAVVFPVFPSIRARSFRRDEKCDKGTSGKPKRLRNFCDSSPKTGPAHEQRSRRSLAFSSPAIAFSTMSFIPAIPTMSLGSPGLHDLDHKLEQAARRGFKGVELFYGDLEELSKALTADSEDEKRLEAARLIRKWCDDRSLNVIGLQPFMHYEGLVDRKEHEQRIQKLQLWFRLVKILGTNVIQIPTNIMQEGTTGDTDALVQDMIEVADLGLKEEPVVNFAYENLCWGTHIATWQGVWDIIVKVDRPNFGICLDTFNIAGSEWADPTSVDGKIPEADETLAASLKKLRETVDVKKVFYVQVVDAQRLSKPLVKGHELYEDNQPARGTWSRNARVFNNESGGYLPIIDILKSITEEDGLGYKGWISFELFSKSISEEGDEIPEWHALRARRAWDKLVRDMEW